MLSSGTRRQIKEHKWNEHSNQSLFFIRLKQRCVAALNDLTLIANELDESQLNEIFTQDTIEPFIKSLMDPQSISKKKLKDKRNSDRRFFLGYTLLDNSLNITMSTIDNKWAKKMYAEHEGPLRAILDTLYHERKRKLELSA
ncbi:hypothetical protein [Nitrosarchaeum sp. AC2]|uniref:hypothetical protein n=1 Tax=Nitrosarchaeum sp. AC2 TaxID=2259673 RepID=UPI0015C915E4|nr:hypothetical protein [Nitrosarchaeum sp. AC2]QLH11002.1 hypothetical protein DSQ20_05610 [Nitrosarchaeum sp. AC2]